MKKITRKKIEKDTRPNWDEYFLQIASTVAGRSTCLRRRVGALIVKERRILATGYNGTPKNIRHCLEVGCLRQKLAVPSGERHELCRGLHAEQNAIIQAALYGTPVKGSVMYVTNHPCIICAKMMINAGVSEVIIADAYPDEKAKEFFKEAGIRVRTVNKDSNKKRQN